MDAPRTYLEASVSTQQRGRLIVMLYDGAIKFLRIAKDKLAERDYASKGVYIGKAQDIVFELNNSLDIADGGELAQNLRALYNFVYRRLSEANIERSPAKIDDCIRVLDELRGAWEEVASQPNAAATSPAGVAGQYNA